MQVWLLSVLVFYWHIITPRNCSFRISGQSIDTNSWPLVQRLSADCQITLYFSRTKNRLPPGRARDAATAAIIPCNRKHLGRQCIWSFIGISTIWWIMNPQQLEQIPVPPGRGICSNFTDSLATCGKLLWLTTWPGSRWSPAWTLPRARQQAMLWSGVPFP